MPTEPMPVNEFITDLEGQWTHGNVSGSGKKPGFIEVTGASEPMRYNLNVNDQIIARPSGPALQEIPIGNRKFGNRLYNITLEVYTNSSRQRLYDVMREIRRVCHARIHSLTNFQRIQFMDFNELTNAQANVWAGTISVQLVNNAVTLET
mgnify:FL=1|tara:strand:- start:2284 stop:2733 length:450 start_codon:yes stop_codon:yes gene_type:complete